MNFYRRIIHATPVVALVSAILLSSCNPKSSNEESGELTVIKFEEASDSVVLTDSFKDISCIQLEMTENSILGKVKTILDADGNIVVLTKDYDICMFNKEDGRFIRQIGSVGEGPEEFITAREICYDHTNKTIIVFDGLKREFISYRLTGEFVERFKAKGDLMDVNSIVRASDGTMLACNKLYSEMPDLCAFTIINPDHTIENIDPFAPLIQPKKRNSTLSIVWGDKPMSACGDELKFVKVLTDTLCSVKGDKVTPLYKLDFGKEILTKEKIMEIGSWTEECLDYCIEHRIFTYVRSMFETSRYIMISPDLEPMTGNYWIDKETGKGIHIASTYDLDNEIRDVIQGNTIIRVKGANERELISCFESEAAFAAFKDAIAANRDNGVLPENVISSIESYDPEGNPFLIIYSH